MLKYIDSFKIIFSSYLVVNEEVHTFKPRSKKKRIQKKAKKLYRLKRRNLNSEE